MTPEALKALADLLPAIEQPGFVAGEMQGGDQIEPGVFRMPYASYGPVASAFVDAAYAHDWVMNFDWSEWAHSPDGQLFAKDKDAILSALADDLSRLITVFVRQDRFVEGALLDAFESGFILRIVQRAAALVGSNP